MEYRSCGPCKLISKGFCIVITSRILNGANVSAHIFAEQYLLFWSWLMWSERTTLQHETLLQDDQKLHIGPPLHPKNPKESRIRHIINTTSTSTLLMPNYAVSARNQSKQPKLTLATKLIIYRRSTGVIS
jgi:hypothetical protein